MMLKRRGRPRLPKGEGKRHVIGIRVTAQLRRELGKAAADSGRSLSQEAELRLEQTFRDEKARYEDFGDKEHYDMMKTLAIWAGRVEAKTGKSWLKDWETFVEIKQFWEVMLKLIGPSKSGVPDLGSETAKSSGDRQSKKEES